MKKFKLMLIIVSFLLSSSVEAEIKLNSTWMDIIPKIDGRIHENEWGEASFEGKFAYQDKFTDENEEHPFTAWLKNNDRFLYIGMKIVDDELTRREIIRYLEIYFSINVNHIAVNGFERFRYYQGKLIDGKYQENREVSGYGRAFLQGNIRSYELKIPLNSDEKISSLRFTFYYAEIRNEGDLINEEWKFSGGDFFPHDANLENSKSFALLKISAQSTANQDAGETADGKGNEDINDGERYNLKIYGYVKLPSGKPVVDAIIKITCIGNLKGKTNEEGYYEVEIKGLTASDYSISIIPEKKGYTFNQRGTLSLNISSNTIKRIDFIAEKNIGKIVDEFEPDNNMENAKEVEIGKLYHHSLSQDDVDWGFFVGKRGYFYVISTLNLSEDTDTTLQVWKNGKLIDGDDDSGLSLWASKVEFISKAEGFYFVKVEDFSGRAGFYSLSVDSFNLFREIPLPAPLRRRKESIVPEETALLQNYPNPFNPETWIPFELAKPANVIIRIYSLKGQLVRTLNLGHQEIGSYLTKEKAAHWDGRNEQGERTASGIYFYTLGRAKRKLAIIK